MHSALLMALIAAPAPAAAPAAAGFWTDLPADQAMASARREGTPVMIDLYATWCGPCQKLDKDVFPDPEVRAEAKECPLDPMSVQPCPVAHRFAA